MSRRRWFLLSAICALSACSASSEDRAPVGKPLTSAQSYVVHGRLTLAPRAPASFQPTDLPTEQDFVLRVDPTGGTTIAGGPGQAVQSPLTSPDGVVFRAIDGLSLALDGTSCGSQVTYPDFHFTAGLDALAGAATGTASIGLGDVQFTYEARLDFTGVPDTAGPALTAFPTEKDPLVALMLKGSEPLPAQAKARLVAASQQIDLVAVSPPGTGTTTSFDKPDIALRYATSYAVVVDPWTDLAGNPGQRPGEIVTIAPPPLAAEDGFESAIDELGGAPVLTASALPPISGQKSALVALGDPLPLVSGGSRKLTVRLAVRPGDRFVRFSLRPVSSYSMDAVTYGATIRLAIPGGAISHVAFPSTEHLGVQQVLDGGGTIWMGDTRAVEVALPPGVADEVVFDFRSSLGGFGCGARPPAASYQIDDLRVE